MHLAWHAAERLRALTAAFQEPVLGWFSFRPDTRLHLSMREQVRQCSI